MKDSKEHILITSLTLFLQKSFKEVTMKEIVDNTGMSKGAFYHYFNSKEQVFAEVINHFFMEMMIIDYSKYSQDSLKAFYTDLLEQFEKNRAAGAKRLHVTQDSAFTNNYYYLIFDAMRMLPEFKEQQALQHRKEMAAWKKMIAAAKKAGEIRTPLTDEQVAKLFIYLGDGTNLNLIIAGEINKKKNELKVLWEGLYASLKTGE